jgi:hypothetical protein
MTRHTLRLFFGRYTHAVMVRLDDNDGSPATWCAENMPKRYRRRRSHYGNISCITLYACADEYQQIVERFSQHIVCSCIPFNADAEQSLLQGMELVLRDHLYFNRYSYAVRCYAGLSIKTLAADPVDLRKHIGGLLGVDRQTHHIRGGQHFPVVYTNDDATVIMLKLAIPEHIIGITKVYIHNELP